MERVASGKGSVVGKDQHRQVDGSSPSVLQEVDSVQREIEIRLTGWLLDPFDTTDLVDSELGGESGH